MKGHTLCSHKKKNAFIPPIVQDLLPFECYRDMSSLVKRHCKQTLTDIYIYEPNEDDVHAIH